MHDIALICRIPGESAGSWHRWRLSRAPAFRVGLMVPRHRSWLTRSDASRGLDGYDLLWGRPCLAEQPVLAGWPDVGLPAELGELPREIPGAASELDEPVARPVGEAPFNDLGGPRCVALAAGGRGLVVDEQHAAAVGQCAADH